MSYMNETMTLISNSDLFSASTVLLAQTLVESKQKRISRAVDLATDLMKGMQERGKALTKEYLAMLERLKLYVRTNSGQAKKSGQDNSLTSTTAKPYKLPSSPSATMPDGDAAEPSLATEINVNFLLEDLTFPWNIGSGGYLFDSFYSTGY